MLMLLLLHLWLLLLLLLVITQTHICIEFIHVKEGSFYVVLANVGEQNIETVCNLAGESNQTTTNKALLPEYASCDKHALFRNALSSFYYLLPVILLPALSLKLYYY